MNTKNTPQMTAGVAMMSAVFFASAVESAHLMTHPPIPSWQLAASEPTAPPAAEPRSSEPRKKEQNKEQELARPPVKPAPVESKTPEEAAARAADRKDPSGALIVNPPMGAGSPAKPR